ncbi:MAG: type III pantothenate kinase, partial [Alistipes sp.]|nr:type III pantothenate kinase [Alistipes sp.]
MKKLNLAVDIGNSLAKAAVFEQGQCVENFKAETADTAFLDDILRRYPEVSSAIMVSSRGEMPHMEDFLAGKVGRFLKFGPGVPVPLRNLYT